MATPQSLEPIGQLLGMYPGVSSTAVFISDIGTVSIHFRCVDFESLKAVAECAVAANVSVCVGDPSTRLCYEDTDAGDCPFCIRIKDDCTNEEPPSVPEIFGVYLARDLKRRELIPPELSDALQSGWNAVPL